MKVILLQDQPLGKGGDVKEVADGFARHYLIPRRLVMLATKKNLSFWEGRKEALQKRQKRQEAALKQLAESVQGKTVCLELPVHGERIFGAVTAGKVSQAIRKQWEMSVDRKAIRFLVPIKETGQFPFKIVFAPEVEAEVSLEVRPVSKK